MNNQLIKFFISTTILTASTILPVLANPIPDNLKVPNQQVRLLDAQAKGVQIYVCKAKAKTTNQYEWTLKAPEAILLNSKNNTQIGKHYGGPTWEANDGSKVVGEVKNRVNSRNANTIPWLLLAAKSHAGNGIFSKINYIQRVDTTGGKAPTSGCDSNHVNAETRVNYTATYYFYGAAR
jgi:Protein of unknown function (DUF3455)